MRRILVVMVAAALAAPSAAAAHGGLDAIAGLAGGGVDVLEGAVRLDSGLLRVPLRTGPALVTHGADEQLQAGTDPVTGVGRPPLCAQTHRQHVLYGRPVSAADGMATARAIIEGVMMNMNAELDRAALESGGVHADYRVKCEPSGQLSIGTFLNLGSASFRDVVDAARLAGATDGATNYTIFYDDPSPKACGIGSHSVDETPGAGNASNVGGGYAVVYRDCWNGVTAMHENGHNMGAVQAGAPNATVVHGHCRDENDVMCYADGAEGATGMRLACMDGERFDCGYDDYFDAAPEPGEYLATHWNIGSRENRFIDFSEPRPGEPAPVLGCRQSEAELLAVDTLGCDFLPEEPEPDAEEEEEEEVEEEPDPPVRIVRAAHRADDPVVRARLVCPGRRSVSCSGRLQLARRVTLGSGGRVFRLRPGARRDVALRLHRAWRRGAPRRVWVVARANDASADAARPVRLRRR